MRALLVGDVDDARGFALAGVETRVAVEAREVERALAEAARAEPPVGLVIVSAGAAALAPRTVAALAARGEPPAVVVLP
jgi:vacuolar-type H+-ATPase subunit F/Vma7